MTGTFLWRSLVSHLSFSAPLHYCSQAIYAVTKISWVSDARPSELINPLSFHWFALKWHRGQMLLLFQKPNTRGWSRHTTLITTSMPSIPSVPRAGSAEAGLTEVPVSITHSKQSLQQWQRPVPRLSTNFIVSMEPPPDAQREGNTASRNCKQLHSKQKADNCPASCPTVLGSLQVPLEPDSFPGSTQPHALT